jgi:hypothetical protein
MQEKHLQSVAYVVLKEKKATMNYETTFAESVVAGMVAATE